MIEVDVKNVTKGRRGGRDQLGFGVLICTIYTFYGHDQLLFYAETNSKILPKDTLTNLDK